MIKQITIYYQSLKENLETQILDNKLVINCLHAISKTNTFEIEIEFSQKICLFRNHDYTWIDVKSDRIANEFTSKIIKLEDGTFIQANINQGIWEINSKNPSVLRWKFNAEYSKPIAQYVGETSQKQIYQAKSKSVFIENPTLLFSKMGALEISRSQIPFSAIACFTDHCDFDTVQNLKLQRQLFKECSIKVTKGFFLNHFSKRSTNASYQNDSEELDLWKNDGHEMCYHSLSQSIKSNEESFDDFENFQPPFNNSYVWIDHGFQPYNFTLFTKNNIEKSSYENILSAKNITTLWNYIDSGTATKGIINQLNTSQFTVNTFLKGIKKGALKTKIVQLFKNIIFHYDNDEKRIRNYIDTITHAKKLLKNKKIDSIIPLIKNAIPLLKPIFKITVFWKSEKNKPYKVAKYAPLLFKETIFNKEFFIFQTLEMVDFKSALHQENINSLIKESGIFIAHTYFSVDMKHYSGKLFLSDGNFDKEVVANFKYLGLKISENKIWNPTLSELSDYFFKFDTAIVDCTIDGKLYIKNNTDLIFRIIN